jgi:hypothetical protein
MSRHALDRAALLAATAHPNWPADAITDLPLGAIGSSLLRLRAANFGPRIEAHADCQQCGERLAVALEVAELLHGAAPEDGTAPESPTVTVADGLQVRASSLRDLAAVASLAPDAAADALLARCTLNGRALPGRSYTRAGRGCAGSAGSAGRSRLHPELRGLRPRDQAQLDTAALLWDEITARAGALLHEVHRLASAYGWSEADPGPVAGAARRYLALVEGMS